MSKAPDITESEWKIMKVLWAKSPLGAYDIIEALAREQWHQNTIKTMLARLTKKKALKVTKYKNLHLYSPLITEEDGVHAESEDFLQRVFGGAIRPLLVHFARRQKLTKADIEELKRILEKES